MAVSVELLEDAVLLIEGSSTGAGGCTMTENETLFGKVLPSGAVKVLVSVTMWVPTWLFSSL